MEKLDSLYQKMPVLGQHVSVSLYGLYWYWLRFGTGYSHSVKEYQRRELLTQANWAEWQDVQLKFLLPVCANQVPYYRKNWSEEQKYAAMKGDLSALPLLEKDPIRTNSKAFQRDDIRPFHPQAFLTSGSTGTPITSYYTIPELRQSIALREVRSANWAGVSFRLPRATFSGRMVEPDPNSSGPFYRFNLVEKQVYFSAFHLKPDTAQKYVDVLRHHKIQWGTGYAVSFYLLARFMLEQDIQPPGYLKSIITTSEKLTPEMRSVMEQAYGCRVYEEFSTVENAIFASECEQGRLHVSPDVSVVEILRPDGSSCDPGEAGEVVVTTLARTYHPLIRYRLGDIAIWDVESCPCGRQMPVIKEVVGRIEDVVIGPDGRQMVRFHGVFSGQLHVREGQIVQEALDSIRVKVVTVNGFGEDDVKDITHRIQKRLGSGVHVIVEPVTAIPRTRAGKYKAVVSLLKKNG